MYTVFVRSSMKVTKDRYGREKLEPCWGRKTILTTCSTTEEARAICKQYNDTHNPGKTDRMAEFTLTSNL